MCKAKSSLNIQTHDHTTKVLPDLIAVVSCRELLLAFTWLVVHEKVVERVLKHHACGLHLSTLLPPYPNVRLHCTDSTCHMLYDGVLTLNT